VGTGGLTRERLRLKFLILATSSAEKLGDTSLLIGLTWQAIMMVLSEEEEEEEIKIKNSEGGGVSHSGGTL